MPRALALSGHHMAHEPQPPGKRPLAQGGQHYCNRGAGAGTAQGATHVQLECTAQVYHALALHGGCCSVDTYPRHWWCQQNGCVVDPSCSTSTRPWQFGMIQRYASRYCERRARQVDTRHCGMSNWCNTVHGHAAGLLTHARLDMSCPVKNGDMQWRQNSLCITVHCRLSPPNTPEQQWSRGHTLCAITHNCVSGDNTGKAPAPKSAVWTKHTLYSGQRTNYRFALSASLAGFKNGTRSDVAQESCARILKISLCTV